MRTRSPGRFLAEVTDSDGLDSSARQLVLHALDLHPGLGAVYSIGGGNQAILDAFAARRRPCRVFIAHDLDRDNRRLLAEGRLSAVLHHDLAQDMRRACQVIMAANGALDGPVAAGPASIQIITPVNLPAG
jgi:LacI family transcriptional regulator